MAELKVTYPISKAMRDVLMTVEITGLPTFRFRVWLAGWLMRGIARILGCGIEVKFNGSEKVSGDDGPERR